MTIQVVFKCPGGRVFSLQLTAEDTVEDIYRLLVRNHEFSECLKLKLRIWHRGFVLASGCPLSIHGILNGDALQGEFTVAGGAACFGFPSKKMKDLESKARDLDSSIKDLESKNEKLQKNNEDLEKNLNSARLVETELSQKVQNLVEHNQNLQNRVTCLEEVSTKCEAANLRVQELNQQLEHETGEKIDLHEEIKSLKQIVDSRQLSESAKEEKLRLLLEEKEDLRKKLALRDTKVTKLESDRIRLQEVERTLTESLRSCEHQLHLKQVEAERLVQDNGSLRVDNAEVSRGLRENLQQALEEQARLVEANRELSTRLESSKDQLQLKQQEAERLVQENGNLREDLQRASQQRDQLTEANRALSVRVESSNQELSLLQGQAQKLEEQNTALVTSGRESAAALSTRCQQLEAELSACKDQLQLKQQEAERLVQENGNLREDLQRASQQRDQLTEANRALSVRVESSNQELSLLQGQVQKLEEQNTALVTSGRESAAALSTRCQQLEAELSACQTERARERDFLVRLQAQKDALDAHVRDLESSLALEHAQESVITKSVIELRQENDMLQATVRNLEAASQKAPSKGIVNQLQKDNEDLKKRVHELESSMASSDQNFRILQAAYKDVEAQLKKAISDHDEMERNFERRVQQATQDSKNEVGKLRAAMQSAASGNENILSTFSLNQEIVAEFTTFSMQGFVSSLILDHALDAGLSSADTAHLAALLLCACHDYVLSRLRRCRALLAQALGGGGASSASQGGGGSGGGGGGASSASQGGVGAGAAAAGGSGGLGASEADGVESAAAAALAGLEGLVTKCQQARVDSVVPTGPGCAQEVLEAMWGRCGSDAVRAFLAQGSRAEAVGVCAQGLARLLSRAALSDPRLAVDCDAAGSSVAFSKARHRPADGSVREGAACRLLLPPLVAQASGEVRARGVVLPDDA